MYQIDFGRPVCVHFIGIGGISMSGLASVLLKEGFTVTGSESVRSDLTDKLSAQGAVIAFPQAAENIPGQCDVVVYTAAIHPDNPEFREAQSRQIPMLTRAQLLGQVMANDRIPVAVAGTHGKTTTTSMLSQMALQADMDPTISVGGILPAIGGNFRVGGPDLFITEACEYTNSFLSFFPKVSIILNIDADHLDFFKDIDDIRRSFRKFAMLLPEDGCLVIGSKIPRLEEITDGLKCRVITAGAGDGDYRAENIEMRKDGTTSFDLVCPNGRPARVDLSVPGLHNVDNALAAIAAADVVGIPRQSGLEGLASFTGTDRRFQYKGTVNGFRIIDDYAHHPTEVKATLDAARAQAEGEVWCVFQPHTYTRTQALLPEFAEALSGADHIVLADIYAAREVNTIGISSADLCERIKALGAHAEYFPDFGAIEAYLLEHVKENDLLITMGAGNVCRIGEELLAR